MRRRIRHILLAGALLLAILLTAAWFREARSAGQSLRLEVAGAIPSASQIFVKNGALNVDFTGLAYSLRDVRRANEMFVELCPASALSAEIEECVQSLPWHRFGWRAQYIRSVPLQGMTDDAGQPITVDTTLPLKLLSVPVAPIIFLLGAWPTYRLIRRARCVRFRPRAFLGQVARRAFLLGAVVTALLTLTWFFSAYRPMSLALGEAGTIRLSDGNVAMARPVGYYLYQPPNPWRLTLNHRDSRSFVGEFDWRYGRNSVFLTTDARPRLDYLSIPFWLTTALCLIIPVTSLAMRRWGRRSREGHCPQCDYDLRHSPDRCPECGRLTSAVAAPANSVRWKQRLAFAIALLPFVLSVVLMCLPSDRATSLARIEHGDSVAVGIDVDAGYVRAGNVMPSGGCIWSPGVIGVPKAKVSRWMIAGGLLTFSGGSAAWGARLRRPTTA